MKNIRIFLVACVFPLWGIGGLNAQVTIIDGGFCGADAGGGYNLTWTLYSDSVLRISGIGDMKDYFSAIPEVPSPPWRIHSSLIKTLIIGDSVTSIGGAAFDGYQYGSVLTSVTIGNSVSIIGVGAFSSCGDLSSVIIGNSVTIIAVGAFGYCSSLTSVNIGNGITMIGGNAFADCINLTSLIINAVTPPQDNYNAFRNVPNNISVYVPCGSIPAYQDSAGWSSFTNYHTLSSDSTFYNAFFCQGSTYTDSIFTNLTQAGTYYKRLQSSKGCDSIVCLTLAENNVPTISLLNVLEADNGFVITWQGNATSHLLYKNDELLDTISTNNIYIDSNLSDSITYCYKVKAIDGDCESDFSDTICKMYYSNVGIIEQHTDNIRIFPNPTNYELRITNYELRITNYEIYSVIGQKLLSIESLPSLETTIDISHLEAGIYYLKIEDKIIKFIKK